MSEGVDPRLLTRARELVSSCTGFREDAISADAVERVVRGELARGRSISELLVELQRDSTPLAQALVRAVLVGETYFFRHPEHFRFIAAEGVPQALRRGATRLRGWSAGCASGEEAYSLAACLLASAPQGFPVEVVGTDIHEESLATARRAQYGSWSRRESGPHLFPLYQPLTERHVQILEPVRAITTFMVGNLLAPPETLGHFDFILCRNVLTYFTAAARDIAVAHMARALVPGGYLFLGAVEVDRVPQGLVRVGPPELQTFRLPLPSEVAAATPARPPPARPTPPARTPLLAARAAPEPRPAEPAPRAAPSKLHLEALERIEHGDVAGASALLESLVKEAPDYLPGLLELALLRVRAGARDAAYPLMRALHARAAQLPPDQLVEGPEALPARFYRASADAYLNLGAVE